MLKPHLGGFRKKGGGVPYFGVLIVRIIILMAITMTILEIIWEFPKIRGTLFGSPYSRDPTI